MRACLEVDLKYLTDNIKTLHSLGEKLSDDSSKQPQGIFFCPMVKANSYGHGVVEVAHTLKKSGVTRVGVISFEEAMEIKETGLTVYVFGPYPPEHIELMDHHSFIPVVGRWEDLKALLHSKQKQIPFHIEFNMDMNRTGFELCEATELIEYIKKYPALILRGVASHLSTGEDLASDFHSISKQFRDTLTLFKNSFPKWNLNIHLLNSAGFFSVWSHSLDDLDLGFRPGISLYGIKPRIQFLSVSAEKKYQSLDLKPVSCLKSFVVQVRSISPGETVSYCKTWTASRKSTVAVVSMGYADGMPYHSSNTIEVLLRGKRVPVIGRICMDFFMIDATEVAREGELEKGEEVVIFGSQQKASISVTEQADKLQTIPYQLMTGLGKRVVRVYKK